MNKGLIAILAGALLLTVTVPARPGRAQENPRNECKGIHAQLEREHARLKAELARMTAELKRLRDAVRPVQLVEIEDRPEKVLAALEPQNEDLLADCEEIERHAEAVGVLAAHQAVAEIDDDRAEAWLLNEGDPGWLGVTIAEVTADKAKELKLPAARGVILSSVEADSPAARAGARHRRRRPERSAWLLLWRTGRRRCARARRHVRHARRKGGVEGRRRYHQDRR